MSGNEISMNASKIDCSEISPPLEAPLPLTISNGPIDKNSTISNDNQKFVKVSSEFCKEKGEIFELPLESDGCLLLSTLNGIFAHAIGLVRFKDNIILSDTNNKNNNCNSINDKNNNSNCAESPTLSLKRLNLENNKLNENGLIEEIIFAENSRIKPKVKDKQSNDWLDVVYYCFFQEDAEKTSKKQCIDLIVLGMAWSTNEDTMRAYFAQNFGEVEMVQVKRTISNVFCSSTDSNETIGNSINGQSKGYGFVRFVNYADQVSCLSKTRHAIDGRLCEVKIPQSKMFLARLEACKKIYVGGLIESIDRNMLNDVFSKFGQITDIFIPKPFRNFAFITFSDSNVTKSLINQQINCCGTTLFINSASPKIQNSLNIPGPNSQSTSYAGNLVTKSTSRGMNPLHSNDLQFRRSDSHGNRDYYDEFGKFSNPGRYSGHQVGSKPSHFYLPPPGYSQKHQHHGYQQFSNNSSQQYSRNIQNNFQNQKGSLVHANYLSDTYYSNGAYSRPGFEHVDAPSTLNSAAIVLMALELLKNPQILNTLLAYQQQPAQARHFLPQNANTSSNLKFSGSAPGFNTKSSTFNGSGQVSYSNSQSDAK